MAHTYTNFPKYTIPVIYYLKGIVDMKRLIKKLSIVVFVLAWVLIGKVARATEAGQQHKSNVQVKHIDLYDEKRQRPVKITVWFPASNDCTNATLCLAENARLDQGAVFSHGAMGAARGYNWIGYALASRGIVTVGLNHYGESWVYGQETIAPSAVLRFWERPRDVTFVLNQLSQNHIKSDVNRPIFNRNIDWTNVTAIGHSSGGATVAALAGNQLELLKAKAYCASLASKEDKSCGYMKHQLEAEKEGYNPSESFHDRRIKRIIVMDPALGHVTNEESLKRIEIPVLVIGSKQNDFLTYDTHAGYYAKNIPQAKNVVLDNGEGHFVYLDKCDHTYKAIGVSICTDREGVDRNEVHKSIYTHLFGFIYGN